MLIGVATTTGDNWAGRQGGDDKQSGIGPGTSGSGEGSGSGRGGAYKWVALSNTTLAMVMATIDGSIVIIALPAIFRGINLNPLTPGNVTYLLWMIMGYLLVQSILVVTLGRLGDMFGRVKIYNLGFVVFTLASIGLSFDPFQGTHGALWLIGWRFVQAFGGSMLMANSAAILTDAFPEGQRGTALGINQVAGISGQFIGLLLGGLLSAWDWRAVFWVNLPFGLFGTIWAYKSLKEIASTRKARIDWLGNVAFAAGAGVLLVAITFGIRPYHNDSTSWGNPMVFGALILGVLLLALFCLIESKVKEPMFQLSLFRIRAFATGNIASLLGAIARGGLQFMLVIWLAGIWLPLHGYDFKDTPLWAGIYMLPLTAGFLIAGPISGRLSDRFGARPFATGGLLVAACCFTGLMLLPIDVPYWAFALLIFGNGIGSGLFAAPNTAAIMSSVPAHHRGAASGMRSTFQNSGMSLSIGIFFSLLIVGLANTLPKTLTTGLTAQGVPLAQAATIAHLPPVSTVFAAMLGYNPVQNLLGPTGLLHTLPASNVATLTGKEFFPSLISGPFHHGLTIVFTAAALMAVCGAAVSWMRGRKPEAEQSEPPAVIATDPVTAAE
jgi:MFS family permease